MCIRDRGNRLVIKIPGILSLQLSDGTGGDFFDLFPVSIQRVAGQVPVSYTHLCHAGL